MQLDLLIHFALLKMSFIRKINAVVIMRNLLMNALLLQLLGLLQFLLRLSYPLIYCFLTIYLYYYVLTILSSRTYLLGTLSTLVGLFVFLPVSKCLKLFMNSEIINLLATFFPCCFRNSTALETLFFNFKF